MICSSNFLKRWSFQKGPRQHMIFPVIWKDGVFSRKHDLFSLGRGSERRSFSENKWKHNASPSEEKQET